MLVDTAAYVGRPIDEVEAELTALGLVVVRNPVEVSGQVEVPPGTSVTVSFCGAGPPATRWDRIRWRRCRQQHANTNAGGDPNADANTDA